MKGVGLKIALGVSLVVNVFVLGAAVGAIYMRMHEPPGGRAPRGNLLIGAGDSLAPADQDAYRQMLRAQIAQVRPIQQDARAARREAMNDLAAPTFDRAAAGALMARVRADDLTARGKIEDSLLDFAVKLPPQERAALVEGMRRGTRQRWLDRHSAAGGQPPQGPARGGS